MTIKLTQEQFIEKCVKAHGDIYDYSKVIYVNNRTKITICCYKHGDFYPTPTHFSKGHGCSKCRYTIIAEKTSMDVNEFIIKANEVHDSKYDYSKTNYVNSQTKIEIMCPQHGSFFLKPNKHIHSNRGCPKCGWQKGKELSFNRRITTEEFIERSKHIHSNYYDYSKTVYVLSREKVEIICPQHGLFFQMPCDHIGGHGCNKCPKNIAMSKGHQEISKFLTNIDVIHRNNDRTVIHPLEIDIYIPEFKLGIEFNGLYWHSTDLVDDQKTKYRHFEKFKKCEESGIKLLQFWESEWQLKRHIIELIIKSEVGKVDTINASYCIAKPITSKLYRSFNESNNLIFDLYKSKPLNMIGLFYKNVLIFVIGLTNSGGECTLDICCKLGLHISSWFDTVSKYINGTAIIYTDNRFGCNMNKHEFKPSTYLKPEQYYVKDNSFRICSSDQEMLDKNYRKIWDAGTRKWYRS